MSLCFLEAFKQKEKGNITEDEYLHLLLAHFQDAWHDEDEMKPWNAPIRELKSVDVFVYSIWAWSSLSMSISKDIKPLEDIFYSSRSGSMEVMREKIEALEKDDAKKVTESLAVLALRDRRPDVLKICLDRGFAYSGFFVNAANSFEEKDIDPDICKILQESEFRKSWPWPSPQKEKHEGQETDPAEIFDEGGEYEVDW